MEPSPHAEVATFPPWDITGKVCLVTGATHGIGRAAALALAVAGAEVVVGGRKAERCAVVQDQIAAQTGHRPAAWCCDFNSLDAVRHAAQAYLDSGRALHVLLHNAGELFARRQYSADGYEANLAINHLAPFLLNGLLWPRLSASAPARIVVVSSGAHRLSCSLDFADLRRERWRWLYVNLDLYSRSKLCNLLFTRSLAQRVAGSDITVNAMSPGVVYTGILGRNVLSRMLMGLLKPFARTPAQGADTAVWLCTAADITKANGGYYCNRTPCQPRASARSDTVAAQLWKSSEVLVKHRWDIA